MKSYIIILGVFILVLITIIVGLVLLFRYFLSVNIVRDDNGFRLISKSNNSDCFTHFCDSRKWVMNISRVINIYSEMYRIDSMTIIEQMRKVEEKLLVLMDIDKCVFSELLRNYTKLEEYIILTSDSYKSYCNIMYIVYNELKHRYKIACLENHFCDKNEKEWVIYREAKLDYFVSDMNRDFGIYYANNLVVPEPEIIAYYKDNFRNKLKDGLAAILDEIRGVSISSQLKKKSLEASLERLTSEICGLKEII